MVLTAHATLPQTPKPLIFNFQGAGHVHVTAPRAEKGGSGLGSTPLFLFLEQLRAKNGPSKIDSFRPQRLPHKAGNNKRLCGGAQELVPLQMAASCHLYHAKGHVKAAKILPLLPCGKPGFCHLKQRRRPFHAVQTAMSIVACRPPICVIHAVQRLQGIHAGIAMHALTQVL